MSLVFGRSKIIDWVKSLPDAFVPEKVKDTMIGNIDMIEKSQQSVVTCPKSRYGTE